MVRPLARRAIVGSARRQTRLVDGLDHGAVLRLEGQMVSPRQVAGRRRAVGGGDEQLIHPEVALGLAAQRNAQRSQHGVVEAPGRRKVGDHQLDVINQTAAMQGLGFHGALSLMTTVERTVDCAVP